MSPLAADALAHALTQLAGGGCESVRAGYEVIEQLPAGAVQGIIHGM